MKSAERRGGVRIKPEANVSVFGYELGWSRWRRSVFTGRQHGRVRRAALNRYAALQSIHSQHTVRTKRLPWHHAALLPSRLCLERIPLTARQTHGYTDTFRISE